MLNNNKAFTLIETIIVVAIISVLASIAVANYLEYRGRGYDAAAKQDLKNVATAEEAHFITQGEYVACSSSSDCVNKLEGVNGITPTVNVQVTTTPQSFVGTSSSTGSKSGSVYTWDSSSGFQ